MDKRKYDFIIFGAAGFTGKYTVEEWVKYASKKGQFSQHSWAVAGHDESSLIKVMETVGKITEVNLSEVAIIIADATKPSTLIQMTENCSVLINCVGPFRFLGENVIEACLATQTHCVDVSGEAQYLMKIQLQYNDKAKDKGIYLIGSCGFDSIPADCGATMLQQEFNGVLNSIELFYEYHTNGYPKRVNYGTWQSEVHIMANNREWRELEEQVLNIDGPLPELTPKLPFRGLFHYNQDQRSWCVIFPQCDASVVRRSQYYFYKHENRRPVQIYTYMKAPLWRKFITSGMIATSVMVLSRFRLGIQLLEKHPKLFSVGHCSHSGPSREAAAALEFKFILVGHGWHKATDEFTNSPNKKAVITVSGRNPGYGATGIMLLQSALTLLNEKQLLPKKGGVYTPGVAFAKSTLIRRLNAEGIKFEMESLD